MMSSRPFPLVRASAQQSDVPPFEGWRVHSYLNDGVATENEPLPLQRCQEKSVKSQQLSKTFRWSRRGDQTRSHRRRRRGILDAAALRGCMGKDEDASYAFLLTCVLHTACTGRAASAQSNKTEEKLSFH
ncbi:hypothetical protein SRHO_G00273340 [Serrasalmus rhombeus]